MTCRSSSLSSSYFFFYSFFSSSWSSSLSPLSHRGTKDAEINVPLLKSRSYQWLTFYDQSISLLTALPGTRNCAFCFIYLSRSFSFIFYTLFRNKGTCDMQNESDVSLLSDGLSFSLAWPSSWCDFHGWLDVNHEDSVKPSASALSSSKYGYEQTSLSSSKYGYEQTSLSSSKYGYVQTSLSSSKNGYDQTLLLCSKYG